MDALDIQNLSYEYGSTRALDNVSFRVSAGALFGILGPNGSGKSTLFRCLSTLQKPLSGTVTLIESIDLLKQPARAREIFGTIFQHHSLDESLTVSENLMLAASLYGIGRPTATERIRDLASALDVSEEMDIRVGRLSGGMARRVDLLRGLLHQPEILLLDEPTTGLDPAARRNFWNALHRVRTSGRMTVLFTTHLMREAETADRVLILDHGAVVANGDPAELHGPRDTRILIVRTRQTLAISEWLKQRYDVQVSVAGNLLHVASNDIGSMPDGIQSEWGSDVDEITIRRPSLEDIFFERTGHQWNGDLIEPTTPKKP